MATGSKLAVIVHADVAGSTALVRTDEGIAHDRIQAAFRRSSDIISKYGGITHELRGDALVAEFERASDAVSAALALQILNEKENARLAGDIRPVLRLGISLGEVVVADDTLTGPGVVLAQRVEQLAVAGGVAVTEAIREAVPERMLFEYEDHGSLVQYEMSLSGGLVSNGK